MDKAELRSKIFEAIGAASVCWEDGKVPTGTFDDVQARKIADELEGYINQFILANAVVEKPEGNRPYYMRIETYDGETYDSVNAEGTTEEYEQAVALLRGVVGDQNANLGFDVDGGRVCIPARDIAVGRIIFVEEGRKGR